MSYALSFSATEPAALWAEAGDAAAAIVAGEPDGIANMANVAALIWQAIPNLNWAGFYRFDGQELVLGPFQGQAACIRIPLDKGVCGAAARLRATQRVEDVHAFPGHIACDAASRSELVVPIVAEGRLIGLLDLDSPSPARFTADDQAGAEALIVRIDRRLELLCFLCSRNQLGERRKNASALSKLPSDRLDHPEPHNVFQVTVTAFVSAFIRKICLQTLVRGDGTAVFNTHQTPGT